MTVLFLAIAKGKPFPIKGVAACLQRTDQRSARLQAEKCFLARTCRARKRIKLYFATAVAKLYEVL